MKKIQKISEAKEWTEKAKHAWENAIKNSKKLREKELLDYHHEEIIGDDEKLI